MSRLLFSCYQADFLVCSFPSSIGCWVLTPCAGRSVEEQMCSYAAIISQKSDQYGINIAEDADGDGDIGLDCCSLHGT